MDDERPRDHPEFAALWLLNVAERQARAKLPPTEAADTAATPDVDPVLIKAASLHRSTVRLETKTVLDQFAITIEMEELISQLAQLEERRRQIKSELWARYRSLKHIQYRMVDPAVAAGYFHKPRAQDAARRRVTLTTTCTTSEGSRC